MERGRKRCRKKERERREEEGGKRIKFWEEKFREGEGEGTLEKEI